MIQIAMFNHKGGVAKTTSAFHLGWMLAQQDKKVMLVDCDPQCNLTGLLLQIRDSEDYPFEGDGPAKNIRDGLAPAFEARPVELEPVELQAVPDCSGLFVLPGHVGFAEYESQLAVAHELSGSLSALQNIPGSLRYLFDITSKSNSIDISIIDMSPSLGAINQNVFSTSDAFLIPMSPDYFSSMALRSLSRVLPKWKQWSDAASTNTVLSDAAYPWPSRHPKYLGSIVSNYRIRARDGKDAAPTRAYDRWFDDLRHTMQDNLLPSLVRSGMTLDEGVYHDSKCPPEDFLLQVPDFNSLIAISQELSKPVFKLTRDDIKTSGSVAINQLDSRDKFLSTYREGSEKILALIQNGF